MKEHRFSAPDQLMTNASIRLRVGVIFAAGLILLLGAVVGVTLGVSATVTQDDMRLETLRDWLAQEVPPPNLDLTMLSVLPEDVETKALTRQSLLTLWTNWRTADQFARQSPGDLNAVANAGERRAEFHGALANVERLVSLRRSDNAGMIRGMYAALFLSSLLFLLIGLWLTQQIIVAPVEELERIAHRIAVGDLSTPVALEGQGEFRALSRSFETMRRELLESRERTLQFTRDLEAHVTQRTQQLAALSEVVAAASRSFELDLVLRTALEQALQVVGVEIGGLWLAEEASGDLHLAVAFGMTPEQRQELQVLVLGEGVTGRALQTGHTITVADTAVDPGETKHVSLRAGVRSIVGVPIRSRDRVVGVIDVMTRQPRTFAAEEIALLTSIGQQIGIAVDSVRLMQEVRAQTQQVGALQERERIGIELHDGLLQTLSYLYLQLDQLEAQARELKMPEIAQQLETQCAVLELASHDLRRFIADLREAPPAPPISLQTTLREMAEEVSRETGVEVTLLEEGQPLWVESNVSAHLVRIVHEAIFNAARHGRARRAVVALGYHGEYAELTIKDDGAGFRVGEIPKDGREHFGLSIMQARAARIGGALSVESQVGQGVCVRVMWTPPTK